jgi:hypothetical protein
VAMSRGSEALMNGYGRACEPAAVAEHCLENMNISYAAEMPGHG